MIFNFDNPIALHIAFFFMVENEEMKLLLKIFLYFFPETQ